jgi:ribosome maturation protein SDO1
MMVDVDKAIIARFKHSGETFEILVDCDNALLVKQGKDVDMKDVLAHEKVFSDAKKGLLASESKMQDVFETTEVYAVAKQIIGRGEVQMTADHKAKLLADKKKRILHHIHANGVDPKTGAPHPLTRLELAFEEAKVKIDEYRDDAQQIEAIVKKLRPILPISFETKKLSVMIPAEYAGKAYAVVKSSGKILREGWQSNGAWLGVIELPAAKQGDLFDKLGSLTHGGAQIEETK